MTELKPEQMAAHMQSNAYVTTMPVKRIMEMILDTKIKENEELQELIDFFEFEGCCLNDTMRFRADRSRSLPLL